MPNIEVELIYFYVFSLDYWIQMGSSYSSEKQRSIKEAFYAHLVNFLNMDTLEQRLKEYGQIVNVTQDDSATFFGLGRKLSEFCGISNARLFVLAPSIFTEALNTISIIEK